MLRFSQIKFIIALLAISYLLLAASSVSAALVPACGDPGNPCKLCHLFVLLKNIIDFLVTLSFPLAGLVIAFGGILYLTAGGNPGQIEQGKKAITAAVMGIVIVLVAWLVVDTFLVVIAGGSQPAGFPWPWNDINCPT